MNTGASMFCHNNWWKENSKAPRHWPLWEEFAGDQWMSPHKGTVMRKMFPFMTSSQRNKAPFIQRRECYGCWYIKRQNNYKNLYIYIYRNKLFCLDFHAAVWILCVWILKPDNGLFSIVNWSIAFTRHVYIFPSRPSISLILHTVSRQWYIVFYPQNEIQRWPLKLIYKGRPFINDFPP